MTPIDAHRRRRAAVARETLPCTRHVHGHKQGPGDRHEPRGAAALRRWSFGGDPHPHPQMVMDFATAVEAYRVVVNAPCSRARPASGRICAPTFTIGTGFFGRSSIGENIGPQHLVHWTQVAYHKDSAEAFARLETVEPRFAGAAAGSTVRRRARQVLRGATRRVRRHATCRRARPLRPSATRGDPAHHRRGAPAGIEGLSHGRAAVLHFPRSAAAADARLSRDLDPGRLATSHMSRRRSSRWPPASTSRG